DASVYAMKGVLYELQGSSVEAEHNYVLALQRDPATDLAANNLAFRLAEDGRDLSSALGYAQGARKHHPEDANIADTLAWVYYKMGTFRLAKESAEFAVSKEPRNGEFLYHLGLIYKATDQLKDAERALKTAVASPVAFRERKLAESA